MALPKSLFDWWALSVVAVGVVAFGVAFFFTPSVSFAVAVFGGVSLFIYIGTASSRDTKDREKYARPKQPWEK